mgnify:CR=1 FL=1
MESFVSEDQLKALNFADPYIQPLGLSRVNLLGIVLILLLVILYFLFSKQLYSFKESTKASLRKSLQGMVISI